MLDTNDIVRVGCLAFTAMGGSLLFGSTTPPPDCSEVPSETSIHRLLKGKEFEELDALASRSRDCKADTRDGLRPLDAFYRRVTNLEEEPDDSRYKEVIQRLEQWIKAKPDSPTPHVALAMAYRSYAWKGRGHGAASTVSVQGWKLFKERMALVQAELARESTLVDPQAYVEGMKSTAAGFKPPGTNEKEYSYALFRKGIQVDADYYPLYYEMATRLLQQWGGEPGEWEAFARESSDTRGGAAGQVLYSRILWEKSRWFWQWDFLPRTKVPWGELKTMLDGIAAQRPDSAAEKNLYCYFAALGLDFETASKLFDWIDQGSERKIPWVWQDLEGKDQYDYYRSTARAKRQAVFEMNLEPLVASPGELTFTVTVRRPDGSVDPKLGYERSSSVRDFLLAKSAQKHTRLATIPDEAGPGPYSVTMVVRNKATGVEKSWSQELGKGN